MAIALPPGRPPIIVASFISGGAANGKARAVAHRSVAALVAKRFPEANYLPGGSGTPTRVSEASLDLLTRRSFNRAMRRASS